MLVSNTSTASVSSLPRIKKKTKSTSSPSGGPSSTLQEVSLDYGFRDNKENLKPRSKNVAKSRSRDHKDQKDRSRSGREDRRSDRQTSQSRKTSKRSEADAKRSEHFSRRSDSSERRSEREIQRNKRNEEFKTQVKADKVAKKESSKISRRNIDKIPLGPKNSNSPRSVRRANDDIRSQLAGCSDIRLRSAPSSSSKPSTSSRPASTFKPSSSSKPSSSGIGSSNSSSKKVATSSSKKAVAPPPSETSSPPIVAPAALPDGAEMTFKYDATSGKWVLPTLPGFSFTFTGAPEVARPAAPPAIPSAATSSSASRTSGSRQKFTKISGRISDSDDDDDDDIMSPPVDCSRDRDFRKGQGPSSCAISETSDCTTVTNPSRDSSDDDVVMDNASTGSSTPRRKSESSSDSSSSSSSDSDSGSDGESDVSRDEDPDALKIDTDSEFDHSDGEAQQHSGYVMVGTDGSGDTSGNDGNRRVEHEQADAEDDADPVAPADPARVVNPPAPVADAPVDEPVAILDDAEFGRILNDLIDRDVPHAEIDAFRRDVPRHAWSDTVNVIRRQNREREHFRARIRYLRGLANPTDAEKEELQNMIVFQ